MWMTSRCWWQNQPCRARDSSQPNLVMQESNIGFSNPAPVDGDTVTAYAVVLNNGAAGGQ